MDTLVLRTPAPPTGTAYTLRLAVSAAEVAAAQRLRYTVFSGEIGATLRTPVPGHDVDAFDDLCDHMIVVDERDGAVIATYRLLPPGRSDIRYAEGEFDLAPLAGIGVTLVETGRSCVHPDHRSGAAINLLWAGLTRYMHLHGHRYLGGCASVGLADGGAEAAGVRTLATARHLAPPAWRITPRRPWIAPEPAPAGRSGMPPIGGVAVG